MIKVLMPKSIRQQIENELCLAGTREIGGILMAEHIDEDVFRVKEFTVQRHGGSWAAFERLMNGPVRKAMKSFFQNTKHQYTRFNYLGEWHSHPSFQLYPSSRDKQSMFELINDPEVRANFTVLLIVKLMHGQLRGNVFLFLPNQKMHQGELIIEEDDT